MRLKNIIMRSNISSTMANTPIQVAFAATNQYVQQAIPQPKEKVIRGYDYVAWGTDNKYPDFLYSLYEECATLQSIINGCVDYIMGDKIEVISGKEFDIDKVIPKAIEDLLIFGAGYINVIKDKAGRVVSIHWLDARKIRSNEKGDVFYYSEDWDKSYGRIKTLKLPLFKANAMDGSSVYVIKRTQSRGTYPTPMWGAAVKSVVTEIEISKYHLNEVFNNFAVSAIINFNNGTPTEESRDEIEKAINEKFTGSENAGRFMLVFNDNKENGVTVERLSTDDYDERYSSMAKRVKSEIFTAFRANPNLFGLPTENLGFNNEEYESTFKLFNRTVIKPIQRELINVMKAFDCEIEITPFSLNNDEETVEDNE